MTVSLRYPPVGRQWLDGQQWVVLCLLHRMPDEAIAALDRGALAGHKRSVNDAAWIVDYRCPGSRSKRRTYLFALHNDLFEGRPVGRNRRPPQPVDRGLTNQQR
ncbi:hypothetical protein [Burkholderia sp. SRS-W-2-2016]|uniref:hypothetical protein n=1 Tax=Burkholderia sp. SRS-W-2-2016 TaxID=1926878 RepID=UPI00117ED5C2|nr:hypothetical protein [Burkholderia sp. SRS-W-2-2016]